LSRVYFIRDADGERRAAEHDLPLRVGGTRCGGVCLPGLPPDQTVALLAISDGHAYVQPTGGDGPVDQSPSAQVFLNHARIERSAWLKSGDEVQVGEAVLRWTVKADQVFIDVRRIEASSAQHAPTPPSTAPAAASPHDDGEPPTAATPREDGALPPGAAPPPVPSAGRARPLRRLAAAVFAVLALAALFVVVAAPVSLEITPEPDTASLDGFPPPAHVLGHYLALPGTYHVRAVRDGYRPLDEAVELTVGSRRKLQFELAELPGRVHVELAPAVSYRLLVDGTPATRADDGSWAIDRGDHRLHIETERYLPAETELAITGLGEEQTVAFTLSPAWADVHVASEPVGATVEVDGESIGETPLDAEIMHGKRKVVVSLAGHKTFTARPLVEAGAVLRFDDIVLAPSDGQLALTSTPPYATVSVDGAFKGITPGKLALTPDTEHVIVVSKAGFESVQRRVTVASEQETELEVALSASYGVIFLTSQPADADLLVDGKAAGKATQRLRLTTRAHALEVRKDGYVSRRLSITPQTDVSRSIDVELKTVEQARKERTPPTVTTAAGQVLRLVRPAGSFTMGASRRDAGRRANESARLVELTRPVYFGEREVTNAEFRRFRPSHDSGVDEDSRLGGDDQPVVAVSWDDAARYCNWLSKSDGLPAAYIEAGEHMVAVTPANTGYRLPTEAEWAYVARAYRRAQAVRYPWGDSYPPTARVGNFADARIADTLADVVPDYDDGYRATAPVASFPANPAGVHDMAGNVAEWTNDYYAVYTGKADTLVRDPVGPASGEHRVVRGSSWRHGSITELRASYRDYSREPRSDLGFRVARSAE